MSTLNTRYGEFNIIDTDSVISRSLRLYGEWAQYEIDLLAHLIHPGFVVVDAGAFIGTHARAFSALVGSSGKVLAFEPRQVTGAVLIENAKLSPIANICVINSALGFTEKVVTVPIQLSDIEGNFGALTLESLEKDALGEKVTITTLDAFTLGRLDFLKIDVEGMEIDVLNGAKETVKRCRPVIFAECNSLEASSPIIKWCQEENYQAYGVLSSAYNQQNFACNTENIFGASQETGMLLIPVETYAQYEKFLNKQQLPQIKTVDDLALLLLHKPQYSYEVLAHTSAVANLSLAYTSPQTDILNQAIAEQDGQIANLNQVLAEQDGQIANLNQTAVEYDGKMAALQQREIELHALYNALRNENAAYRLSTSWRVTRPLRQVSQIWQRTVLLIRLYKIFRDANPGIRGLGRSVRKGIDIIQRGGLKKGTKGNIALYERSLSTALQSSVDSVLVLDDATDKTAILPKDVAVHAHIYYSDLTTEIRSYLENIPVNFHFYVTTDTLEKAQQIENDFSNLEKILALDIRVTKNRGRDILPMLVTLGTELSRHEIVLHIHTKRSSHNTWELRGWRRYLMEALLGNPQRVTAILQQFVQNKDLGILFPDPFHPVKRLVHLGAHSNNHNVEKLLNWTSKEKANLSQIDLTFFPVGDMFWFRGAAIKPFVNMKLSDQDFEPEQGQVDATLAHAIVRMFPYFASKMGLISKSYLPSTFLSQQCSAHQIGLFYTYLAQGLILNPTIIFDHNGGGGSNSYTAELVKGVLADNCTILRIYCFDAIWFIQWIGDGDGMLFYASSIKELFELLSASRSASIVINSLYGYPDIKEAASNIVSLASRLNATLDFKIHDFYSVCSSPHLVDFKGKYCGVPQDLRDCSNCLKNNHGWYHAWYPKENIPVEIAEWRVPFAKLFEAANTVTFFDPSSVDILRKAFRLDESKVRVIPHAIDYFICDKKVSVTGSLHIGILGTLSHPKGATVIKELYDYIEEQNKHIPITVVGSSYVATPPRVKVLGNYTPNDLPKIISRESINAILMPSIVPETFSYTISEAIKMGLPIVAFDMGAQGNRVKQYALGKVVPLGSSSDVILSAIQAVLKLAQDTVRRLVE